ncbi:ankyrin repeat-containing protein [Legionella beliardensis]|uniref:Ankyrin repeat-containing protein n=1 Tax=Legionella beliardensis TaxID=91822 RepID=A0A378I452_9GAMM|nr:Fic family protein [Legionella beliardensis]STX29773.1 ankyrin repeat-containing protein [Legionella beliardensis]
MKINLSNLAIYPTEELYRLAVDGYYHDKTVDGIKENGWIGYERRQPGCLKALFDAMAFAITNLEDKKLTLKLILKLHQIITTNVQKLSPEVKPGEVRDNIPVGFLLNPLSVSKRGLKELLDNIEKEKKLLSKIGLIKPLRATDNAPIDEPTFRDRILDSDETISASTISEVKKRFNAKDNDDLAAIIYPNIRHYAYVGPFASARSIEHAMQHLIDIYNKRIIKAHTLQEKQDVIINLIYNLEHLHPFKDGNIRTLAIALLLRLSLQNNIQIATFEQPNIFDGFSRDEIRLKWDEAIAVTNRIINGEKYIFNFKSATIPVENQAAYEEIIGNFIKAIKASSLQSEALPKRQSFFKSFSCFGKEATEDSKFLLPKKQ